MDLVALVPADLSDLIAGFLQNRSQDIAKLKSALAAEDLAAALQVGERMFALGNPYGFRQITTFGRQIREACALHDDVSIRQVLGHYRRVSRQGHHHGRSGSRAASALEQGRASAVGEGRKSARGELSCQRQPGRQ